MVDILAAELKMDPAEIRLKNFIQKEDFPFPTATGLTYDTGDYSLPLKKALGMAGMRSYARSRRRKRKKGELMGIGISTYGEICAFGPSPATAAGGWESATVKIDPSGKVTVMTGASPHGQGEETTFAQIAADELASISTTSWCCTAIRRLCSTASVPSAVEARRWAARRCTSRCRI